MIRKSTNELLIKPRVSKHYQTLFIGLACILSVAALYGVYQYGRYSGNSELDSSQKRIVELSKGQNILDGELSSTKDSLVFAQRHQQIQDEAYKQMGIAYANAEKKNRYLTSSLDFYRSIISPENNEQGPKIQNLTYAYQQGELSFDITLVQSIKHKHQVRGMVKASLYGQSEKLIAVWPESGAESVNYQYFKHSLGMFKLTNVPDSLKNSAKIKVEMQVEDGDSVERWFDVALDDEPLE